MPEPESTRIDPSPSGKRGRPSRQQSENRRKQLLDEAIAQFVRQGYEGTTMEGITSMLGMSKRTAFAWYKSKADLFRAAMDHAMTDIEAALATLQGLEQDDLEETLVAMGRVVTSTLMSPVGQRLMRVLNAQAYALPDIGPDIYRRGQRHVIEILSDIFHRRLYGESADPALVADHASALLGLLTEPARRGAWGLDVSEIDLDAFVRSRVSLFLHGARAPLPVLANELA